MGRNIVIGQDGFYAAGRPHPGVGILHVDLAGQEQLVAKPGEELLVITCLDGRGLERLALRREPVENSL